MSGLAWARKNSTRSRPAQVAFYFFTWLTIVSNINLISIVHIPGASMGDVDSLSRFLPTSYDISLDCTGLLPVDQLDVLARMCDPTHIVNDIQATEELLIASISWCRQFSASRPRP